MAKFWLLFLLLPSLATASPKRNAQTWSRIKYSQVHGGLTWGGQLQHRYSLTDEKLYEEQLNIDVSRQLGSWETGLIFTWGTENGYATRKEYRLGVEAEKTFDLLTAWQWKVRFRYEARDFRAYFRLAHRVRLRNQFEYQFNSQWPVQMEFSSEFNAYLNEYAPSRKGLSSHRSLLGFSYGETQRLGISYIHDYGHNDLEPDLVRHVLMLSFDYLGSEAH